MYININIQIFINVETVSQNNTMDLLFLIHEMLIEKYKGFKTILKALPGRNTATLGSHDTS